MNARLVVTAVAAAIFSSAVSAEEGIADMKFSRLTSRDGLSCGVVNSVYKDSAGFLWIATAFGLNRYDGTRIKAYYSDPADSTSLAFNNIERIKCDYRGHLWISQGDQFCTFDPETGIFDRHPERMFREHGISGQIYRVFIDSEKCFWLCVRDVGLYYYNPFTKEVRKFGIGKGEGKVLEAEVAHLTQFKRSVVVTYKNGVIQAFDSKARWVQWTNTYVYDTLHINDGGFRVDIDRLGNFWIRTDEGVMIHILKSDKWYTSLHDFFVGEGFHCNYDYQVRDVEMDANGNHWVGTDQGGIIIFNMKTKAARQFVQVKNNATTLSDNTIQYIYCDDNNRMWISTYRNGLNQWSEYNEGFSNVSLGDICTCIEEKPGLYWLGSNDNGIIRYNHLTGEKTYYNTDNSPLKSNTVVASCKTADGSLWFGAYHGGLTRYKDGKFKVYTTENSDLEVDHVWSLCEDRQGYLWIGTLGGGVQRMDINTDEMITIGKNNSKLASLYVSSVSLDINDNIVVGTSHAYSLIDSRTFNVTNVERPADGVSRFSDVATNQAISDSRGLVWMCTTAGLNVYDPLTGRDYVLDRKSGLAGTVVYGVAEDEEGNVWVVTEYSVSKVNVKLDSDHCMFFIVNYDDRDGLQQGPYNQRSISITSAGKILIGGRDGVDVITPSSRMLRTVNPRVTFSDINLYGKEVVVGKEYNGNVVLRKELNAGREVFLKEGWASISIYLASNNCAVRSRTRYTYWVEGLNYGWIATDESSPFIRLTGLTAGTYYVHVKALDDRGDECEHESVLTIHVQGPVWRSWWAVCLYVIAALVIFVLIYRNKDAIVKMLNHALGVEKRRKRAAEERAILQISPDERLKRDITAYVEQHLSDPEISVVTMGRTFNMSHVQLYSELTRIMKVSPADFIRNLRIERACNLLEETSLSTVEIAFATGFRHLHAFVECFTMMKGMHPKRYRMMVRKEKNS